MANGIKTGGPRGLKLRVGSEFEKHLTKVGGHINQQ